MIKVSVCITTFNVAPYIEECLESVLKQKTDFNFEILIGDDYSTDNTRTILKNYEKKYPDKIKVVYHNENKGVNFNDYTLITKTQGQYIAWCDGDDCWIDEYKLAKQVKFLDNHKKFSAVFTNWTDFYEDTGIKLNISIQQFNWERELSGKEYVRRILTKQSSGHRLSSILFRSKYIKDFLSKDTNIYLSINHKQNDVALFCILSNYGPFGLIQDYTTLYRIRSKSLSHFHSPNIQFNYVGGVFQSQKLFNEIFRHL